MAALRDLGNLGELSVPSVPAGWGNHLAPGEKLPVNALRRVRGVEGARLRRDKFGSACNLRLAFLAVIEDNGRRPKFNR